MGQITDAQLNHKSQMNKSRHVRMSDVLSMLCTLALPATNEVASEEDLEATEESESDVRDRNWGTFNPFVKGKDKNLFNADILHTVKIVYGNEGSRRPAKDLTKQAELLERLKKLPLWQLTVAQADVFSEASLLSDAYRKVLLY
jgi:hypothetical protein